MTTAALNTLLTGISEHNVIAFFLVLARISPLFLVSPGFSSQMLLPSVRSVLAVALAFWLTWIVSHGQTIPLAPLAIAALMVENFIVGFALAYTIACVFGAIEAAGVLSDAMAGFSFGQMVDPVNGNAGGALTNLYTIVGLSMFLAIGGDAWTLRGLTATFRAVPLGSDVLVRPLVGTAESAFSGLFVGAIEIAAPLILAVVISDVAFGMVSRVVPQLNVFAVGFPIKVGVSLLIVGVSMPFLGNWLTSQLDGSVASALSAMRV